MVEKYRIRRKRPPSPPWRAFLDNHVKDFVSVDFFVVPTVTFRVLFGFVVLVHARRRIVHFNVTEHRTAQWTAQQLSEAFPWETAPGYLIRDRDRTYGSAFSTRTSRWASEKSSPPPEVPAKSVRRAGDLQHPSRVPGQRHRPQRAAPAEAPRRLLGALSPLALPSLARHGLPGTSACARARTRKRPGGRRSWRPLPSLRATGGLSGWSSPTCSALRSGRHAVPMCIFRGVPARLRASGCTVNLAPAPSRSWSDVATGFRTGQNFRNGTGQISGTHTCRRRFASSRRCSPRKPGGPR